MRSRWLKLSLERHGEVSLCQLYKTRGRNEDFVLGAMRVNICTEVKQLVS